MIAVLMTNFYQIHQVKTDIKYQFHGFSQLFQF